MQQSAALLSRRADDGGYGGVIDGISLRCLILGEIHSRIGCRIHDPIRFDFSQCSLYCLGIDNIEFGARACDDLMLTGSCCADRPGDLAAAKHQHSHGNVSIAANGVPWLSFADRIGMVPNGKGHAIASPGSFQAKVRSCAGLYSSVHLYRKSACCEVTRIPWASPGGTH